MDIDVKSTNMVTWAWMKNHEERHLDFNMKKHKQGHLVIDLKKHKQGHLDIDMKSVNAQQ